MKTIVLDDDPTGTQSATGVDVLLAWDEDLLLDVLRRADSVYLQTNSRAVSELDAVALAGAVRHQVEAVRQQLDPDVLVVLRGDSTLRGHVFAETDVFVDDDAAVLFVPAFPQGGRTTIDGVHRLVVEGVPLPVGETEFAKDPVFGYRSSSLVDFVAEKGGRAGIPVPLTALRSTAGNAVTEALIAARTGEFVVPDVETDADIALIAAGLASARQRGKSVVVRSGAPLAAVCAGVASDGLLAAPIASTSRGVLVVCGSHTGAATKQVAELDAHARVKIVTIDTDDAFVDPTGTATRAIADARPALATHDAVVVQSARVRREEDNTLEHGERVMDTLMRVTTVLAEDVDLVVSKGGITSAEVARTALAAKHATVRGQIIPGISVWDLDNADGLAGTTVVVPGNVGGPSTLLDVVRTIDVRPAEPAAT